MFIAKDCKTSLARSLRWLARNSGYSTEAESLLHKIYDVGIDESGMMWLCLSSREMEMIMSHYLDLISGISKLPSELPEESPMGFEIEKFAEVYHKK